MITREEYKNAAKKYFNFLMERYNFLELERKSQNSMLYDVEYTDTNFIISIAYEIKGEGVNVIIFKILDGIKSDYDDYENTIHLNRIMKSTHKEEIVEQLMASRFQFEHFEKPESDIEAELLKKAELLSRVMRTTILSK